MENITIGESFIVSLLGMLVVFVVLVILMGVIYIMTAIFKSKKSNKDAPAVVTAAVPSPAASPITAAGSCGEIKLFDVPDATAAMVMAIVSDELNAPLNELRFTSIKEVEDNSK